MTARTEKKRDLSGYSNPSTNETDNSSECLDCTVTVSMQPLIEAENPSVSFSPLIQ